MADTGQLISANNVCKITPLPKGNDMALEFDRSIIGQVFDETSFPAITKEEII